MVAPAAVTALEFDASGAERGAREYAAAGEKIKAANRDLIDTEGRLQKSLKETERSFQRLEEKVNPLLKMQRRLDSEIDRVTNARIRGIGTDERAAEVIAGLTAQYEALANKAEVAARAEQEAAIATERARQAAETAQIAYGRLAGVNQTVTNSARASAAVFEEAARAEEAAARAAAQLATANDNLRSRYVPLHAVQQQYLASLREIRTAQAAGVLSQQESVAAIARTKEAFAEQVRAINGLNPVLQSGAGATRNLGAAVQQAGFQVGDFAVQVASGGGVLRPFIQQATQLVSMFGPWGAVLGAAGAVLGALAVSLFDAGDAASDGADALDEYNRMLATTRELSAEAAAGVRDLAGAHRDSGIAALEGSIGGAVRQQDELQRRIRAQQEFVRALQQGPTFGDERRQAEKDLAELTEQFDRNAAAIDGMNNRLFILRDSLGAVDAASAEAAKAQAEHKSAVDTALERLERQVVANDNAILTWGREEEAIARVQAEQAVLNAARDDGVALSDAQSRRLELLLGQYEATEQRLRGLREETRRQQEAERDAAQAAAETARAREKAAQDSQRAYERVIENIRDFSEEALGDSFYDLLRGETTDFAEFFRTTMLRAIANVAAAAATTQLVMPIATGVVGAVPGLFGLGGQAAGVAQQAAGSGGLGSFLNPITSAITQGFSQVTGGISAFLFGTPTIAPAAVAGVAAVPGGLSAAGVGGSAGLLGSGGAANVLGPLAGAAPYLAIAAIAIPILMNMFGRKPSVGETSVGRITDLTRPEDTVFSFDNGGSDTTVLEGVIKAVTDAIEAGTKRFDGTLRPGSGFDFGFFPSPEAGNSQAAGINIKPIIDNILEDTDRFKGLSEQEATDKATLIALREMVDYQSATLDQIAKTSDAKTASDFIADLEFGRNFDRLNSAIVELEGSARSAVVGVEGALGELSNATLEAAKRIVAMKDAAEGFAEQNARPIADFLEKARDLFPGQVTREVSRQEAVRGVYTASGPEGDGSRFVEEGSAEFDRLTGGDNPLAIVTQMRGVTEEVTEAAENYQANMLRIADASRIAGANARLLVDSISGAFEPALRGPVQTAMEQEIANLRALAPEYEAVNELIKENYKNFPELTNVLGPLADTLIDVTGLIDGAIETLRARYREDFEDSLQARRNAATGLGRVNDVSALVDRRDLDLAEAAAVGTDAALVLQTFGDELRNALDGASVAELGRILDSGQIVDAGARAIVDTMLAEAALADARAADLAGLQQLEAAARGFASAANDNARTLRQAASSLLVDRTLSPLSPLGRLEEAQRQLEAAFAAANDNDPTDAASQDAVARLPDLVRTADELARDYYASSAGYDRQFQRGQEILNATAGRQEDIERQQLAALQSIEAAIVANGGAAGQTPSQRAAAQGYRFGANATTNMRIYDALVAAGLPTPAGFGPEVQGNLGQLRGTNSAVDAVVRAMGYAAGGAFAGGMPVNFFAAGGALSGGIVDRATAFRMGGGLGVMGEAGPEAIMPLDRINGRLGVRAVLPRQDAQGGDGVASHLLVAELRGLREDNAALRREVARLREVVAEAGDIGAEATRGVSRTIRHGQRDRRQRGRLGAAAA